MVYESPYPLSTPQEPLPDDDSDFDFTLTTNVERLMWLFAAAHLGGTALGFDDVGIHNIDLFEALAAVTQPEGSGEMEFAIAKWELPAAQAPPSPILDQWWDVPINISVPSPAPDWVQITGNIMRLQAGTYGLFAFMDINTVNYIHGGIRLFNKSGSLVVASGDASQFDNQSTATVITRRAFGGVVLSVTADIALQAFIPSGVPAQPFGNASSNPAAVSSTNWADVILIKV